MVENQQSRIKWIDQYRGFLAVLVVVGHMISWCTAFESTSIFGFLYVVIYTFHMPAFFLLAGFLDKTPNCHFGKLSDLFKIVINHRTEKRVLNILVPTLFSDIILACSLWLLGIMPIQEALFEVDYWFVWAMLAVSITYPIGLALLRSPAKFAVLLLIAVLVTSAFNSSISMALGYYFCYVFGVNFRVMLTSGEKTLKRAFDFRFQIFAVFLLISAGVYCFFSDKIVLSPIYKCVFGTGVAAFFLVCFKQLKQNALLLRIGSISLFMYLFQISVFYWLSYVYPKSNFFVGLAGVIIFSVLAVILPLWIYDRYHSTIVYRFLFSPYQTLRKILPDIFG